MNKICIYVSGKPDIDDAVRKARTMATVIGFAAELCNHIANAAAELAANLLFHGGGGVFVVSALQHPALGRYSGLELAAADNGPGIADIAQALQGGYSTAGGMGCGLSVVRQLMDELEIDSRVGRGTVVRARKWL